MFPHVAVQYYTKRAEHLHEVEERELRVIITSAIPSGTDSWNEDFPPPHIIIRQPASNPRRSQYASSPVFTAAAQGADTTTVPNQQTHQPQELAINTTASRPLRQRTLENTSPHRPPPAPPTPSMQILPYTTHPIRRRPPRLPRALDILLPNRDSLPASLAARERFRSAVAPCHRARCLRRRVAELGEGDVVVRVGAAVCGELAGHVGEAVREGG
ncbi:hypothetical protein EJ07DRAFT_179015 [Lizonia empirigonia]|nr:hypothetical protein EJ07DRAFT_179015 [Lizonia empirigonia]